MAFYTSISASIVAPATESKTAEGVDVYEIKGINAATSPGIPVVMHVDRSSDNGKFLKSLSEKTKDGTSVRVLVSGIMQPVLAMKNDETKEITKPPKVIVYVGAARRLRADSKVDPEQAIVFGSGFCTALTDYEDKTKRKPELMISSGTESLTEAGTYCSQLQVLGDSSTKTDEFCLNVDDGREVYFMANLFRSKGEMKDIQYDKLKVIATFAQETDRVRSRKGGGRPKPVAMDSQLSDSFEESESEAQVMSSDALCQQAAVALSDF